MPDFKTKGEQENYEKYEALFQQKNDVVSLIPFSKKAVKVAIDAGDINLDTLPLAKWDVMTAYVGWTEQKDGKKTQTLSQQVCLLKHAARYHYFN